MKIVFTTDTIQRGGKERQLFILSSHLIKRGDEVNIVSLKMSEDNYIEEYKIDSQRIIIIREGSRLEKYSEFKKIISNLNPDVVFSWDFQTSFYNLFFYKKGHYKFINGSIQHGIRLFRLTHILRSFVCWFSPFVAANSYAGLRANNLNPGRNRFVIYNGIESGFENDMSESLKNDLKRKVISKYAANPGVVFISVANLVPYKDYFTVLSALKRIKEEYNFYYFIIGDGPLRKEIESKIVEFDLSDNVILAGKTTNVADYLKISDIMIHSSRGEGISNAILEGMFSSLPVIATNVGGVPETIYPGSSMLFSYKNENELYMCLIKYKELINGFNPHSKEYLDYLRIFSVDKMLDSFDNMIKAVLS